MSEFRSFLFRNTILPFFIITACISVAIPVLGLIFKPEQHFGYDALLSPAIFGLATTLPSLVKYSRRELSVTEIKIRSLIQFILIEAMVLFINYINGAFADIGVVISVFMTVLIIYTAVIIITFLNDKHTAQTLNKELIKMKKQQQSHIYNK